MSRRKSHKQRQRRQRRVTLAVGAFLIIGLVAIIVVLASRPIQAPIPDDASTRYDGIPQGTTSEGYPILGDPDAPIQVVEYSSFDCPNCVVVHEEMIVPLVSRVRDGEFALIYRPIFGTGNISGGERAARAALCAGQQGAFWEFHDALFAWQTEFLTQAFVDNRLRAGIEQLDIEMDAWETCLQSDLIDDALAFAQQDAQNENEYNGAPAVYVNGRVAVADLTGVNTVIAQVRAELESEEQSTLEESSASDADATAESSDEEEGVEPTIAVTDQATDTTAEPTNDENAEAAKSETTDAANVLENDESAEVTPDAEE